MGLLLLIIALFIFFVIAIPVIISCTAISLLKHSGDRYYKNLAKGVDIFGCVFCAPLFNLILIKKEGYQFGDFGETLSSCFGKNERDNTLLIAGKIICKILNTIEKDHCKNSIK